MRHLILWAVLAFTGFGCHAQYTILGTIRDVKEKNLVPGATVQLDRKVGTVTDAAGRFHFSDVSPGAHTLWVRFVGYVDRKDTISLQADVELDYQLIEKAVVLTDEVIVRATRAVDSTPTTFVNVSGETLKQQNFGQDLPLLLNWTPSVVTTSDAGAGVGYTGIRIRGSDATRVNVTINGIPYNDSESQSTFWVDIPDIASSTKSIQVQRGVGTSTNGAGAFGASVNLETKGTDADPYAELIAAGGSFRTQRYTLRAGTGLMKDRWSLDVKASRITSDGYVERASSDLTSYYVSAGYHGKKTMLKAISFGGLEKTYQSWYGVDEQTMRNNRRMNFAGALYDASGNITNYYGNQVDDYRQDHYQLHASHQVSSRWSVTGALHYTLGRGFYEEYQQGRTYASVGLPDFIQPDSTYSASDMVVRKWLDNRFYGFTYGVEYTGKKSTLTIGGAVHQYSPARHFGEITWTQLPGSVPAGYRYYSGNSEKGDRNMFIKWNYRLTDRISSYADIQYRGVTYATSGTRDDLSGYVVENRFFDFFNPKVGISYSLRDDYMAYVSYAIAHREPNRSDYLEGSTMPRPERLNNLELGVRRNAGWYGMNINYFLMQYTDQLVQTGALDNAGYPIRTNVGNSYRTGVEVSGSIRFAKSWVWTANATWSANQNRDFTVFESGVPVVRDTKIILSPDVIAGSQLAWSPWEGVEAMWLSKYVGKQYLDNTESESVRMNDYWVNDLRLSYTIVRPKGINKTTLSCSLLVNNLLDVAYASNGYSYGGVPYYFPQAGRNFMTMMALRF
ncbi:MAG: TonB-dependent receptor [Cytophagales bacterium]|nr:TonB-dependent receptor [Cytophagales bacterium]